MVRDTAQGFSRRYEMVRDVNSALSLSRFCCEFSLGRWRPAPEKIRSKNERLSAQTSTRRYEIGALL